MIKILQLNSFSGTGGGQKVMFGLVRDLKDKFEMIIVAPSGAYINKYQEIGVEAVTLDSLNLIDIILKIRSRIKEESPDILHVHGTRAAIWGRIAKIGLRKKLKLIYTLHGFHVVRRKPILRRMLLSLERFLNRQTDVVVCVSDSDREKVLKFNIIDKRKTVIIKNGINFEEFKVTSAAVEQKRKELGLENKIVLLSAARLHEQKDFATLINAAAKVFAENDEIVLLIAGDGPQKTVLENQSSQLGIAERVIFLGEREDIPVLLNMSDIAILSTRWEGLPLFALEAAACSKPIVVSNVGGIGEVIVNGQTGQFFETGSDKDLADKLKMLISSKELRESLGNRSNEFVLNNFTLEQMNAGYVDLYLQ